MLLRDFELKTESDAYALGLLLTDGCMLTCGGKVQIIFNSIDKDMVEWVGSYFNHNVHVQYRDIRRKPLYSTRIGCTRVHNSFRKYGMVEQKSARDISCYPDVPDRLFKAFFLGCLDGDGSVFFINGGLHFKITSSDTLVIGLVDQLERLSGIKVKHLRLGRDKRVKSPMLEFRTSGQRALAVLDWVYSCDFKESLKRKRDVYEEYKKRLEGCSTAS